MLERREKEMLTAWALDWYSFIDSPGDTYPTDLHIATTKPAYTFAVANGWLLGRFAAVGGFAARSLVGRGRLALRGVRAFGALVYDS